jgi:hypothetical protein
MDRRLSLQEIGTRYTHYMELREVFMDGIDVLTRMNQNFISDADKIVKVKLQNAVDMITRRLDVLSDFADKTANYGDLARQIRLAGKHVTPLLETKLEETDVKPQDTNKKSDSEDSGDTTSVG